MELTKEIEIALETFKKMKASVCDHMRGPHDLAPMLHLKYPHLNGYCGVLLPEGHPTDTVPAAWERVIQDGVPEFVIVMVEGYATISDTALPKDYRRGEMENDFKSNPESKVLEVLNIHGIDMKTGNQADGFVAYRYNDSGLPEFEEPSYGPCEGEALQANMPRIFTACRQITLDIMKKAV